METIDLYIQQCTNLYGYINDDITDRLKAFYNNPTVELWDDVAHIIIRDFKTVWNFVIQVDSSFPNTGRSTDLDGNVTSEWKRIPTRETFEKAIELAATSTVKDKYKL